MILDISENARTVVHSLKQSLRKMIADHKYVENKCDSKKIARTES